MESGSKSMCFGCKTKLAGCRFVTQNDKPYCVKCFESRFASRCDQCKDTIGAGSKEMLFGDNHYHDKCFNCSQCRVSLVGGQPISEDDRLYCSDCHDEKFASRCAACNNVFRSGAKKQVYRDKRYHEECFKCKICRLPIGLKSFFPDDDEAICDPCYKKHQASRCAKCRGNMHVNLHKHYPCKQQVISDGGVTYEETPWHRECFTCDGCKKMLGGEKFTTRDEKPYCSECFAKRFAKKCARCTKPIVPGVKFISYDERHWHSECFLCSKCHTSLVGRGFTTQGQNVVCPGCDNA